MRKPLTLIFPLLLLPAIAIAANPVASWQNEVISLISHQRFSEAGAKIETQCIEKKSSELCLILASAHYGGETKFGINDRSITQAYHYTKLACDYGSAAGCKAYEAAIENGELLQAVLFEPDIKNREIQLQEAIALGADLNATTLFTATLLQHAINEERIDAVKLLLKHGADANYRVSDEDLTPLMYAINSGSREMVNLLLENGADPMQKLKVANYLKLGKAAVNACDFAHKLEKPEMLGPLQCADTAPSTKQK